jgi:hypothetical protein
MLLVALQATLRRWCPPRTTRRSTAAAVVVLLPARVVSVLGGGEEEGWSWLLWAAAGEQRCNIHAGCARARRHPGEARAAVVGVRRRLVCWMDVLLLLLWLLG